MALAVDLSPIRAQSNDLNEINRALAAMDQRVADLYAYLRRANFPHVVLGDTRIDNLEPRTIKSEHVNDLSADKLTAGIINVLISLGIANIQLDGPNSVITIKDSQGVPVTRVKLGKLGTASTDWGLNIYDSSAALMWSFSGGAQTAGIAANAISNSAHDVDDSSATLGAEAVLNSVTISTDGGYVLLLGGVSFDADAGGWFQGNIRIRKDNLTGTVLHLGTFNGDTTGDVTYYAVPTVILAIDASPASSQTYVLTGQNLAGTAAQHASNRRLVAINLKK